MVRNDNTTNRKRHRKPKTQDKTSKVGHNRTCQQCTNIAYINIQIFHPNSPRKSIKSYQEKRNNINTTRTDNNYERSEISGAYPQQITNIPEEYDQEQTMSLT